MSRPPKVSASGSGLYPSFSSRLDFSSTFPEKVAKPFCS